MIGFYDYTVALTYIGLVVSTVGMTQAIHGRFKTAIVCLAVSGLCDMFDGKIARTKKNRTEDEMAFGVQIDSLCDMVCFGAFPALICYLLGVRGFWGLAVIGLYVVASVIRLAFFNVMEMKGALVAEDGHRYYRGLPITSISVALPMVFLVQFFVTERTFVVCLYLLLLSVGSLFVADFQMRKPTNKELTGLVLMVAVALSLIVTYSRYAVRVGRDDTGDSELVTESWLDELPGAEAGAESGGK